MKLRALTLASILAFACSPALAELTGGGVTKIIAGANTSVSPTNGIGNVTISATAGGAGSNTDYSSHTFTAGVLASTISVNTLQDPGTGVVFYSSGTLVVQSTSTVGVNKAFLIENAADNEILSVQQNGKTTLTTTDINGFDLKSTSRLIPRIETVGSSDVGFYFANGFYSSYLAQEFPTGGGGNYFTGSLAGAFFMSGAVYLQFAPANTLTMTMSPTAITVPVGMDISSVTTHTTGASQFSLNLSTGMILPTNTPICWGSLSAGNCIYSPSAGASGVTQVIGGSHISVNNGGVGVVTITGDGLANYNNTAPSSMTIYGTSIATGNMISAGGTVSTGVYQPDANVTDGAILDYTSGLGRLSVFGGDALAWYTGGVGATMMAYHSATNFTIPNASSATFTGNVGISTSAGIIAGTSASTMTPCGMLFFMSSDTVVGSTWTANTALTSFSTYTVAANVLTTPGDALQVECVFQTSGTAPGGTVLQGIFQTAARGTSAATTTNANITVQSRVTLVANQFGTFTNWAKTDTSAATTATSVTTSAGIGRVSWDNTAAQTFYCKAQHSTGAQIGFAWMRVSKVCQ